MSTRYISAVQVSPRHAQQRDDMKVLPNPPQDWHNIDTSFDNDAQSLKYLTQFGAFDSSGALESAFVRHVIEAVRRFPREFSGRSKDAGRSCEGTEASIVHIQNQVECSGKNSSEAHAAGGSLRGHLHGRWVHGGSARGERGKRQHRAQVR